MARFQLTSMSSYAKNKLLMCSVTQHQSRRRQMYGKCSQIHPVHSLLQIALECKVVVEWNKSAFGGVQSLNIRALIFRKDALYDATLNYEICNFQVYHFLPTSNNHFYIQNNEI